MRNSIFVVSVLAFTLNFACGQRNNNTQSAAAKVSDNASKLSPSKSVVQSSQSLQLEVTSLQESQPSVSKNDTCFKLGALQWHSQMYLDNINNVVENMDNKNQIESAFHAFDEQQYGLGVHCIMGPEDQASTDRRDKELASNLSQFQATLAALTSLGQSGVIKNFKPLNFMDANAKQTDIDQKKYPWKWGMCAEIAFGDASELVNDFIYATGATCFKLALYSAKVQQDIDVMNTFKLAPELGGALNSFEKNVSGFSSYCHGPNTSQLDKTYNEDLKASEKSAKLSASQLIALLRKSN